MAGTRTEHAHGGVPIRHGPIRRAAYDESLPTGGRVRYHIDITRTAEAAVGQIVVRGIPEEDMDGLDERARRLGRSREQEVRLLIARAAAEERGWSEFERRADEVRERLAGRSLGDTTDRVRTDRDER